MPVRKTKNYFKQKIEESKSAAFSVIEEVVKRYGTKQYIQGKRTYDRIVLRTDHDMEWNFRITQFEYTRKGLFVWIYWQGDDVDGDEIEKFDPKGYNIPIQTDFSGMRVRRPALRVTSDDLYDAIKAINF